MRAGWRPTHNSAIERTIGHCLKCVEDHVVTTRALGARSAKVRRLSADARHGGEREQRGGEQEGVHHVSFWY